MLTQNTASPAADRPAPKKKGSRLTTVLLILIMLVGVGLILYPRVSDYWNSLHQSRAIMTYAGNVADLDDEEYEKIWQSAQKYNEEIATTGMQWTMTDEQLARYESELNIDGTGIMGYIEIPEIDCSLAVYHGVDDAVLQTSIGHLAGTSLPVGGSTAHSVLSGHRGLPSAKLFTDLDKLKEGDTFSLHVLNQTLTYQVDQINVVEPDDLSKLTIENGKDYCTLVTCTPYGINTHRLLVRGHRIPNPNGDANVTPDALRIPPILIIPFAAGPALVIFLIWLVSTLRRRKRWKLEMGLL